MESLYRFLLPLLKTFVILSFTLLFWNLKHPLTLRQSLEAKEHSVWPADETACWRSWSKKWELQGNPLAFLGTIDQPGITTGLHSRTDTPYGQSRLSNDLVQTRTDSSQIHAQKEIEKHRDIRSTDQPGRVHGQRSIAGAEEESIVLRTSFSGNRKDGSCLFPCMFALLCKSYKTYIRYIRKNEVPDAPFFLSVHGLLFS